MHFDHIHNGSMHSAFDNLARYDSNMTVMGIRKGLDHGTRIPGRPYNCHSERHDAGHYCYDGKNWYRDGGDGSWAVSERP